MLMLSTITTSRNTSVTMYRTLVPWIDIANRRHFAPINDELSIWYKQEFPTH